MRFCPRCSLSLKFLILTSCVLLLAFSALETYFVVKQREILMDDLQTRYEAVARSLASASRYGLLVGDSQALERMLRSLGEDEDVAFGLVTDLQGTVEAGYGRWPLSRRELRRFIPRGCGREGSYTPIEVGGRWIWIFSVPVCIPAESGSEEILVGAEGTGPMVPRGAVVLGVSLDRVNGIVRGVVRRSLEIALLVVVGSFLLVLLAARLVTRPLKRLTAAAYRFSGGEVLEPMEVGSGDEIGELATAFNRMMERIAGGQRALAQANARLEEMNRTLESQVEERTVALRETIRDLLETRDRLEAAYREVKQMHDLKAAFLRSASHELRTPLTAIKANIDYLTTYEKEGLSGEALEVLGVVKRNINHIAGMVEEILEIVRLESPEVTLKMEELDLTGLVEGCVAELEGLRRHIQLRLKLEDGVRIRGDRRRLHDLVANLLSNAYRFTPPAGWVEVELRVGEKGIGLRVSDTGVGIPADHLPHIFEPFYQVTKARGGSGLGLAIVKAVVERHGGWIEVESQPGKGTTFSVTLPRELLLSG